MERYPIRFVAQERRALWGRELWLVSAHPSMPSVVANGPYAGKTLPDLVEELGEELVGERAAHAGGFPLLVKIIESDDRLSLQVHPSEETAKLSGGDPKTEMWYVLDGSPDAFIFAGLREGVGRDELVRSLHAGEAEKTVVRFGVRRGHVLFIPGGLVHAIGGGTRIYEVQQTSDTTWRLHDWNRVDRITGKPRQLNEEEGLAAIDWTLPPPELLDATASGGSPLIDCDKFRFSVIDVSGPAAFAGDESRFRILLASEGACEVRMDGAPPVQLRTEECVLIPAGSACAVSPVTTCRLLVSGC